MTAARVHHIRTSQHLNGNVDKVWDYVSRPQHLEYLTPPWMRFEIQNKNEFDKIYLGLGIKYKIKAFPYAPFRFNWLTEITEIEESKSFIYQQRIGPYKFWQHKVNLIESEDRNSVELVDEYEYIMPYGFIGEQVRHYIVKDLLTEITTYREQKLTEIFAPKP